LPSQQQLKWAQLRVGTTVVLASITLFVLVFLMSGGIAGLFTPKLRLLAYFDDAGGLRAGAPVQLQGVNIGSVIGIRVVPNRPQTPVEVTMKVTGHYGFALHKDSAATLSTAGVLGETFINISSFPAKGPPAKDGDVLPTKEQPELSDVVRSSQTTLQNAQALLARMDKILSFVESGQGSIGKLIYDDQLYKQLNSSVNEVQRLVAQIGSGKGSVGQLIMSDELYNKANTAIDNLNRLADQANSGQGSLGKFVKDPALYNNLNQTAAQVHQLVEEINAGKGALGKLAKDKEFARKLDDTVTHLSEVMQKLNSGQGTAARFINDPSLYNNTNKILSETQNLIQAIRQDPRKYLTIHMRIF